MLSDGVSSAARNLLDKLPHCRCGRFARYNLGGVMDVCEGCYEDGDECAIEQEYPWSRAANALEHHTSYEYRCLYCGHVGWSAHKDLSRKAEREREDTSMTKPAKCRTIYVRSRKDVAAEFVRTWGTARHMLDAEAAEKRRQLDELGPEPSPAEVERIMGAGWAPAVVCDHTDCRSEGDWTVVCLELDLGEVRPQRACLCVSCMFRALEALCSAVQAGLAVEHPQPTGGGKERKHG